MQYRQGATLAAYRRGQAYFRRRAAELGRYADVPAKRRLDRLIEGLAGAFAGEVRTTKTAEALTERKHELRQHLRNVQMASIVAIARASRLLGLGIDGMSAFRVPRIRTSDLTLLAEARALRKAAKPNASVFVHMGLSRNFLEEFDAVVDELNEVIVAHAGQLLQHHKYSVAAKVFIRQGRETLDMLTALVRVALGRRRPDLMAEWHSAIRVAGKPGPARKRRKGSE